MSEDGASFVVTLTDHVTGPAGGAAGAMENLEQKFQQAHGAAGQYTDAAGRLRDANGRFAASSENAAGAAGQMNGAVGELGSTSEGAAGALEAAGGAALGVAAAVAAAAIAVGALVVKMAELSFQALATKENQIGLAFAETGDMEAAEAMVGTQYKMANASALTQQKFFGLSNSILRAGVSANQFQDTLKALSDVASVAGDQATKPIEKVLKKVEQLGEFKVKDTDLKGSGIKMSEVYEHLASDLGVSVEKIKDRVKLGTIAAEDGVRAMNEALESKFGAAAKLKLLDFDVQIDHLKTNIVNLFSDVDAGPFLTALQNVLSMFDADTAAGDHLKTGITDVMNTIFKVGAQVVYGLEAFFLGFEIAVLKVYIAVHPLVNILRKALHMDGSGTKGAMDSIASAGEKLGFVVGFVLARVLDLSVGIVYAVKAATAMADAVGGWDNLAIAITALIPGVNLVVGGVVLLVQSVISATAIMSSVFRSVAASIKSAFDGVKGLGSDLIDGLVAGIQAGAGRVAAAVTGVAKGAIDAGKSALGINSPSKVFQDQGHSIGEGMTLGIDDSRKLVTGSMHSLAAVPPGLAANDNAGPREAPRREVRSEGRGGGNRSLTIEAGAITINVKSTDPKQSAGELCAELTKLLEELAGQAGGESDEQEAA